ncbi:MAG: DUF6111 family protein [Alphaproteobacteria bacterium]|jgi:hypothetical protein
MRRILLNYLLPLLLPFIVYGIWLMFIRWRARVAGAVGAPEWRDAPWTWLLIVGVVLTALSIAVLGMVGDSPPGGTYIPPHMEGGEIVPGRIE